MRVIMLFSLMMVQACHHSSPWTCDKEGAKRDSYRRICVVQYDKGPCREWNAQPFVEVCKDGVWEEVK